MAFVTKPENVFTLFRNGEADKYKIPKYQRAYSWTEDEVLTFCEDLNEICKSNTNDYFFGAVIMIKDSKEEKTRNIIDGQQRMTTFTILMAQLRDLCDYVSQKVIENTGEYNDDIHDKKSDLKSCLEYDISGGIKKYRLELSDTDKVFFEEYLKIVTTKKEVFKNLEIEIKNIERKYKLLSDLDNINKYLEKIKSTKNLNKDISKIVEESTSVLLEDLIRLSTDNLKESEKIKIKEKIILTYLDKLDRIEGIDLSFELKKGKKTKNIYENIILMRNFNRINIDNEPISHKRIVEAGEIIEKEIINEILDIEDLEEQIKKLINMVYLFLEKTHIVTIISENEETAYTMFQVLNDRGRSLGVVDLLRPHTLQMLESQNKINNYFEEATKAWDSIAEKSDCDKYMSIYLESYTKISRNDKKIHNKYKKCFFAKDKDAISVRNRIKDIEEKYEIYRKLNRGEWPYSDTKTDLWTQNRLREIISTLNYIKSIPLLMAIYDECKEEDFIYALEVIDRVVFRYITVCNKRPNKLVNIYNSTIEDIRAKKSFDKKEFKNNMKKLFDEPGASIDDFREKLLEKNVLDYTKNKRDKILYFLTTIESYYKKDYKEYEILEDPNKTVVSNGKNIDIEHIYSQTPLESYKDKEMDLLVNDIGNLTIIEDIKNKKLGNKPFEEKKSVYTEEKLTITNILDEYKKWKKKEIEERKNMYIDIAERIFTLN